MTFEKDVEILRLNSKQWNIGPQKEIFIGKLVRKYGRKILHDLNKVVTNPFCTMTSVADIYGLSRERIRQIISKLYGYDYTFFIKKLAQLRAENEQYCRRHPIYREDYKRGGKSEAEAFRLIRSMGYDVKPSPTTKYDMIVNGYKIDIKSAGKPRFLGKCKQGYYIAGVSASQTEICDFFILHAIDTNRWFIIPNTKKGTKPKGAGAIYIRVNEHSNRLNFGEDAFATPSLHENNWSILKAAN